jgi:outer membrane receptor protein involved in Fe transport
MIPNLSLSIDWFDIKVKNAIQSFGADAIMNACVNDVNLTACGLVHRNAAGSLWLTSDGYITDLRTNIGGVKTRGFEFNGNWAHEVGNLGRVSVNLVGTLLDRYTVDNGLTATYNCVGYYGASCGNPLPKWRHKARVGFNLKNGMGVSAQWRYMGAVDVDYKNPSSTLAGSYYAFGSHIGAQSYFDLNVNATLFNHINWRLGVNNVFDKTPPLVTSAAKASACAGTVCNGNTYPGPYDGLGRYIYTGVTLDF